MGSRNGGVPRADRNLVKVRYHVAYGIQSGDIGTQMLIHHERTHRRLTGAETCR